MTLAVAVHCADSYVMKLFDRSVDLAQFSEDTPLYPVCRAWIRNKPHAIPALPGGLPSSDMSQSNTDNEVMNEDVSCLIRGIYFFIVTVGFNANSAFCYIILDVSCPGLHNDAVHLDPHHSV
jgi:LIN37